MRKFVLVKNGEFIHFGETLVNEGEIETPVGKGTFRQEVLFNEDTLPYLLRAGIVAEVPNTTNSVPTDIGYYMNKVAKRLDLSTKNADTVFHDFQAAYLPGFFSMMLKEVAIELDKQYDDHIEASPRIYSVSLIDGRITEINKAHIKSYRNFAAFRSMDDARIACRILKPILKRMFNNDSKE